MTCPLAHHNPKKFRCARKRARYARRATRGALRARAPLRGNSAACASRAARQMHMPTHIMKAGSNMAARERHVAIIDFFPTPRENAPIFACRVENQSSRRGARCASSTHSPCPRRTPARAAPHWSLPATSTRGGSATSGSTPMRPPGVHLAHSGRWLLPAARMLRIQPFFRDSSTPSTHRTVHVS